MLLDCWKREGKIQTFFGKTTNYFANLDKISTSFKNEKKCSLYSGCKYWIEMGVSFLPSDPILTAAKKSTFQRKWPVFVLFMCIWKWVVRGLKRKCIQKKNVCIHISFIRGCDFSFVNIVMIWICRMGQGGNACQKFGKRSTRKQFRT